jgi:hypothetical protein
MPVPFWPVAMRQTPQRSSWTGGPQDTRAKFEPEYGPPILRRRTTTETEVWQGMFPNLNAVMRNAFAEFWATSILGGSLAFCWRDPVTGRAAMWRILGSGERAYDMAHKGAGLSDLSVQMMRLPGFPWWETAMRPESSIVPGLVLDFQRDLPSGSFGLPPEKKPLSALVSATRASTGTFVNPATGLLQTAGVNVPRLDANGLLIEAAATNRALWSQEFDQATWVKTRATITANAIAAPDGTVTADKLVETAVANTHFAAQTIAGLAANTTHTFTVYVRGAERTNGAIRIQDTATPGDFVLGGFQLTPGTIASQVGGAGVLGAVSIEALPNSWWRVRVSGIPNATATSYDCQVYLRDGANASIYTGDGTSGLFVWGAQMAQNAAPTSYILTTSASQTRAADVVSLVAAITAQDVRITDRSGGVTTLLNTTLAAASWPAAAVAGARSIIAFPAGTL